jgi:hypothetical protein
MIFATSRTASTYSKNWLLYKERCGVVVNSFASYSGGPGFESRPNADSPLLSCQTVPETTYLSPPRPSARRPTVTYPDHNKLMTDYFTKDVVVQQTFIHLRIWPIVNQKMFNSPAPLWKAKVHHSVHKIPARTVSWTTSNPQAHLISLTAYVSQLNTSCHPSKILCAFPIHFASNISRIISTAIYSTDNYDWYCRVPRTTATTT